jgi:hypothetical protein
MGGIFHHTLPLPDAAVRAQRTRDRLERIQTEAIREDAEGDALAGALGGGGVPRALEAEAAVFTDVAGGALTDVIGLRGQRPQGCLVF